LSVSYLLKKWSIYTKIFIIILIGNPLKMRHLLHKVLTFSYTFSHENVGSILVALLGSVSSPNIYVEADKEINSEEN